MNFDRTESVQLAQITKHGDSQLSQIYGSMTPGAEQKSDLMNAKLVKDHTLPSVEIITKDPVDYGVAGTSAPTKTFTSTEKSSSSLASGKGDKVKPFIFAGITINDTSEDKECKLEKPGQELPSLPSYGENKAFTPDNKPAKDCPKPDNAGVENGNFDKSSPTPDPDKFLFVEHPYEMPKLSIPWHVPLEHQFSTSPMKEQAPVEDHKYGTDVRPWSSPPHSFDPINPKVDEWALHTTPNEVNRNTLPWSLSPKKSSEGY